MNINLTNYDQAHTALRSGDHAFFKAELGRRPRIYKANIFTLLEEDLIEQGADGMDCETLLKFADQRYHGIPHWRKTLMKISVLHGWALRKKVRKPDLPRIKKRLREKDPEYIQQRERDRDRQLSHIDWMNDKMKDEIWEKQNEKRV